MDKLNKKTKEIHIKSLVLKVNKTTGTAKIIEHFDEADPDEEREKEKLQAWVKMEADFTLLNGYSTNTVA